MLKSIFPENSLFLKNSLLHIDDDDFLPDLVTSDTENKTTTEPEKTPEHDISVPEEIPELDITHEHYSPPPEEIPVPEDSPEPDNITPVDSSPQRYLLT